MGKEILFDRITAKNVGFDLNREAENISKVLQNVPSRRKEVIETAARQIRTYESETLEDSIVSFYPSFIHIHKGKTKLFSSEIPDEEFLMENQIDPLERQGMVCSGFDKLQEKIGQIPGSKLILWISPRGQAGTEGIYKDINYGYHQIYVGESKGVKNETYALKSDVDEAILAEWLNSISNGLINIQGESPEDFLMNPIVQQPSLKTNALDTALLKLKEILEKKGRKKFYKDIEINTLPNLIKEERSKQEIDTQRIAVELDRGLSSSKYFGLDSAKEAIGGQLYVLYDRYANERGEVELKGCAGGSVSINSLLNGNNLISNNPLESTSNIFSTKFRLKSSISSEDEYGSLEFKCPHCGETNKRPPHKLIENCQNPKCGKSVKC